MKIGLLGKGTASAISLLVILENIISQRVCKQPANEITITCIHDPNIPIVQVGETTTPKVLVLLNYVLDFSVLNELSAFDGTFRYSNKLFWEKANGNKFEIDHPWPGLHVNSQKFGDFVFNKAIKMYPNTVRMEEDHASQLITHGTGVTVIGNTKTYDFDYVIDCRGTPTADDFASGEYLYPEIETMNSVILFPQFKEFNEMYTTAKVHENGWMFGVPLSHRKAWGYCYNKDITTREQAEQGFKDLYPEVELDQCKHLSWRQYYKKTAVDGRVLYLGNKLYFFEPIQAIPLHFYSMLTDSFCSLIFNHDDVTKLNQLYTQKIVSIQALIALNYIGENKLDTPFWNTIQKSCKQTLKNNQEFMAWAKKYRTVQDTVNNDPAILNKHKVFVEDSSIIFGLHNYSVMKSYIEGYKINMEEFV